MSQRLRRSWSRVGRRARWSLIGSLSVVVAILAVFFVLPRPVGGPVSTASYPPGSTPFASDPADPASTPSGFRVGASDGASAGSSAGPGDSTPGPTARPPATPGPTPNPISTPQPVGGAIQHIIWVWLENTEYGSVTTSSMPYLTSLALTYGLASNYFAIGHNSEMNYLSAVAGQHGTYTDGSVHIPFRSVWDQLAGGWRAYQQDIPSSCYTGSTFTGKVDGPGMAGIYVERHNPATVFTAVAAGGCNGHVFPLVNFNPTAASFIFVTPNLCNDAHNGCNGVRLLNADHFLRAFVPEITASPDFAHTLLFITFDEGTTKAGLNGDKGGHIYTAVVAPWLSHVTSTLYFDHYSLLRTVEDTFGLPCLANACQRTAMTPFLR